MSRRPARAELLRRVLADGRWHSRGEIFEKAGYMLTNNAASELRATGVNVVQRRWRGNYEYAIVPLTLFGDAA